VKIRSEVYRHFSGSKALDFPAQDGHVPAEQQPESRGEPTLIRKFRPQAAGDTRARGWAARRGGAGGWHAISEPYNEACGFA